jgi:ribonuclease HI
VFAVPLRRGVSGVAFVALDARGALHLERGLPLKDATNQRAEILAACFALRELPAGSAIVVFADSEHVVKGWNEWLPAWRKNGWHKKGGVSHRLAVEARARALAAPDEASDGV